MNPIVPLQKSGQLTASTDKRAWQSWGLSLLLHVSLIVGTLVLYKSARRPSGELDRQGGIVMAIVDIAERETEYLTEPVEQASTEFESDVDLSAAVASVSDNASGAPADFPVQTSDPQTSAAPVFAPAPAPIDVSQMLRSTGSAGFNERPVMSEEELKELAEEQALVAARKPKGEPVTLSVFGSDRFSGRKFVFLLDQSESMGSGGLGVLDASKSELDREIAKLLDYHEFQIVAYNDRTSMIGKRRLIPATAENKRRVVGFIEGLVAVGGTEHLGGLMAALGLEPDVIVLISDGGDPALTEGELSVLAKLAKDRTQIHCLQFGATATPAAGDHFMRKLAAQNGGSFRYIDVSQWETNKN